MTSIESGIAVREEITAALRKMDLGLDRGLSKLSELLEAQKPIAALIVNKPGKDKKSKDADEATHDFVDVPDNQTQIKALDMLFKLNSAYPSEKHDVNINGDINLLLEQIDGTTTDLPSKRKGKKK
ncbi:MAG: hypothetical protein ABFD76_15290 [Smithella sp.]